MTKRDMTPKPFAAAALAAGFTPDQVRHSVKSLAQLIGEDVSIISKADADGFVATSMRIIEEFEAVSQKSA